MNRLTRSAMLLLAAASTPAWSQGKLDANTMKAFGGTYQVECGNNASPKATVFPDALIFLHGDKRVAGSKPQSQTSFYGNSPPPEYRIMLVSEAPGGQLMFAIHEDKAGYYLKLDGAFIRNLARDSVSQTMVTAVIKLARTLNFKIIAEQVEDSTALDAARRMGVDFIQGFVIARPAKLAIAA